MVFYNLFTFLSDAKAVSDVRALVLRLLEDEQLEVCAYACIRTYTRLGRTLLFLRLKMFFDVIVICYKISAQLVIVG